MQIKVLHILDCYLPETMNWIEALLDQSSSNCEHHIAADYLVKQSNKNWKFVDSYGQHTTYPIPTLHKILNAIQFKRRIKILKTYISKHSIQVVHIHFGHMLYKYYPFLEELNLGFCCSLYGFDYEYLPMKNRKILSLYTHFGANLKARFIVEGKFSKNVLIQYGVRDSSIQIVRMIFERGNVLAITKYIPPIHFIQIASFSEKKNQLGFLEHLPKQSEGLFKISMYGEVVDSTYFKEVLRAKEKLKCIDIQIKGKLNFGQYIKVLQGTHFAVNLSRKSTSGDTEGGCPVFIKDALILGKPVLTTTHCDIPEWVYDGYNGWLFPEDNLSGFLQQVEYTIKMSPKEYGLLSRNAKDSFRYQAATNQSSLELLHIYESLL